jgi:hypothetical protein
MDNSEALYPVNLIVAEKFKGYVKSGLRSRVVKEHVRFATAEKTRPENSPAQNPTKLA